MGGQEYGGEVKWDVWTFHRNVSKLSCVRVRGRREKRKDARGGPPGYPKGTAFIVVGREKKKKKGGAGSEEDHMHDLYCI